jgi:hypothetical protein
MVRITTHYCTSVKWSVIAINVEMYRPTLLQTCGIDTHLGTAIYYYYCKRHCNWNEGEGEGEGLLVRRAGAKSSTLFRYSH